jgi:hypothetical protein
MRTLLTNSLIIVSFFVSAPIKPVAGVKMTGFLLLTRHMSENSRQTDKTKKKT